jgi:hypothetical protein
MECQFVSPFSLLWRNLSLIPSERELINKHLLTNCVQMNFNTSQLAPHLSLSAQETWSTSFGRRAAVLGHIIIYFSWTLLLVCKEEKQAIWTGKMMFLVCSLLEKPRQGNFTRHWNSSLPRLRSEHLSVSLGRFSLRPKQIAPLSCVMTPRAKKRLLN